MITALCGGVGGAKLVFGLYRVLAPDSLTTIVNTADDLDFFGLRVSPDLDTVMYTLAGLARRDVGWGLDGDTFHALAMLRTYGADAWFQVGDRDLATDVLRTALLRSGMPLSAVTAELSHALGVQARLTPATDDSIATKLLVAGEWIEFQEYFVHRRHSVAVDAVEYEGVESAKPAPGVLRALAEVSATVVVNSNPVLSILPILAVPGIRQALAEAPGPRVVVSPMLGSDSVSGPAGDLMRLVNEPATATGVASLYRGLVDGIVIDHRDVAQTEEIERLGLAVHRAEIVMRTESDRIALAHQVLTFADRLR